MPEEQPIQKSPSGKKGTCCNCGRDKWIAGDGLCGTCWKAVWDIKKDSPEYAAALAAVKECINSPSFKRRGGMRKKKVTAETSDQCDSLPAEAQPVPDLPVNAPAELIRGKSVLQSTFDGLAVVIDKLRAERDFCMARAEKITQAIELLS